MRAADSAERSNDASVVPIGRSHSNEAKASPAPVYAHRAGDGAEADPIEEALRRAPAQIAQWVVLFGVLGALIVGVKWWGGDAATRPATIAVYPAPAPAQQATDFAESSADTASTSTRAEASPTARAGSSQTDASTSTGSAGTSTDARPAGQRVADDDVAGGSGPNLEATAPHAGASSAPAEPLPAARLRVPAQAPYPARVRGTLPALPPDARVQRGIVVIELLIDARGAVADATLVRGVDPAIDAAALAAARQWTFAPTLLRGEAVAVRGNFTVPVGY